VSQPIDRHPEELLQSNDPLLDDVRCGSQGDESLLREGNILEGGRG
jgi:hypothetical protein